MGSSSDRFDSYWFLLRAQWPPLAAFQVVSFTIANAALVCVFTIAVLLRRIVTPVLNVCLSGALFAAWLQDLPFRSRSRPSQPCVLCWWQHWSAWRCSVRAVERSSTLANASKIVFACLFVVCAALLRLLMRGGSVWSSCRIQ